MQLRILDHLYNIQERNGVALSANLKCACGTTEFQFAHTGTQTKGILRPFIVKKHQQLVLKAVCPCCGRNIVVFDSSKDGAHPKSRDSESAFVPFSLEKTPNRFAVIIKYNYFPENFKSEGVYSNSFEGCYIYLLDKKGKEKALMEEEFWR